MRAIRSCDTSPEIAARKLIYGLGYRYRLQLRDLPGKPDLVFLRRRKVIFVHGCFWHRHGCSLVRLPKSNTSYWHPKLERTVERDAQNEQRLTDLGWSVMVIWECELGEVEQIKLRVSKFLDGSTKKAAISQKSLP